MTQTIPESTPLGWSPANPEIRVSMQPNPYDDVSDDELRLLGNQLFEAGQFDDHSRIAAELKRRLDNSAQ